MSNQIVLFSLAKVIRPPPGLLGPNISGLHRCLETGHASGCGFQQKKRDGLKQITQDHQENQESLDITA